MNKQESEKTKIEDKIQAQNVRANIENTLDGEKVRGQTENEKRFTTVGWKGRTQIAEGSGPLFHRHYSVDVLKPQIPSHQIMELIKKDISAFCPSLVARFEKSKGSDKFEVGDEFCVHITGPFPAHVRVEYTDEHGFILTTLSEHLEAGQIAFYFEDSKFHIDSWARSRNELIDFLYDKAPIVRYMQALMWEHFCEAVLAKSKSSLEAKVEIVTDKFDVEPQISFLDVSKKWAHFIKGVFRL